MFTLLLPHHARGRHGLVFGGPPRPLFKVGVLAAHIDKAASCRS